MRAGYEGRDCYGQAWLLQEEEIRAGSLSLIIMSHFETALQNVCKKSLYVTIGE